LYWNYPTTQGSIFIYSKGLKSGVVSKSTITFGLKWASEVEMLRLEGVVALIEHCHFESIGDQKGWRNGIHPIGETVVVNTTFANMRVGIWGHDWATNVSVFDCRFENLLHGFWGRRLQKLLFAHCRFESKLSMLFPIMIFITSGRDQN
jgi:hypothetical protein